jgi:2-amino-4-deoxychorismate synthase
MGRGAKAMLMRVIPEEGEPLRPFDIDTRKPFFLLRRKNDPGVWLCTGDVVRSSRLEDIPQKHGVPGQETLDTVSLIPFAQARERGFPVHDGGEPVVTIVVRESARYELSDVVEALPRRPVVVDHFRFDTTSEEYEQVIRRIVQDEIGSGQGSNFVVARRGDATLREFAPESVLSIFRSFLVNEFGTYWTFLFSDGESCVLGATPERHISVRNGEVMMNPISGTYRKDGAGSVESFRRGFLEFLKDEKEIFELFMVTDEELKIMSELCDQGGAILGPLLKEMSKLIHTEYLLLGRSGRSIIDLLRASMFAPTVTGSPVLSAFRVIERYERSSRSYYGATIALIGRDAEGEPTLDAPITIRTLEVDKTGHLVVRVGATLVRGSDAASEVKETEVKIAGVLDAIRHTGETASAPTRLLDTVDPEEVQILLQRRNLYLSRFWFEPQSVNYNAVPELANKTVTIIDNEDNFSNMLKRMIEQMRARARVVSFADYSLDDSADVTIVGPGPGDPTSPSDAKMAKVREILAALRRDRRPFLAECLGHQVFSTLLGLPVVKKKVPFQGAQAVIDLFGKSERVGFYNTFAAVASVPIQGVEVCADPTTHEVHALRGPRFYSVQFHLESILTPRGYELTRDALVYLIAGTEPAGDG